MDTLADSPSLLARLESSILLSSVRGGTLIIKTSPLFTGFKPKLALIIPVEMGSSIGFSQGCTTRVLASVLFTFATWLIGVIVP